jgi:hypothetical protein
MLGRRRAAGRTSACFRRESRDPNQPQPPRLPQPARLRPRRNRPQLPPWHRPRPTQRAPPPRALRRRRPLTGATTRTPRRRPSRQRHPSRPRRPSQPRHPSRATTARVPEGDGDRGNLRGRPQSARGTRDVPPPVSSPVDRGSGWLSGGLPRWPSGAGCSWAALRWPSAGGSPRGLWPGAGSHRRGGWSTHDSWPAPTA